jgi:DNA polymerase III sliding clamp (beta) subunit (PCNA family)
MVTTDGHRLALVLKTIDIEGINEELRILIPKKTLSELLKLITDELLIGFKGTLR